MPDLVREAIRERIASGQLQPGPVKISDLAQQFGVSPVPVREALRSLEGEGLITFNHGRSIEINTLSVEDAREIYMIRTALESILVRSAVPRLARDPAALAKAHELLGVMDEAHDDQARWLDANREFHWGMYELAPYPRLLAIVRSLWAVTEPYLRVYAAHDERRLAQAEHREMVALAEREDVEGSVELLQGHLASTCRIVEQSLAALHEGSG
jgi:DNA-binding GntR family transcriptional regulator